MNRENTTLNEIMTQEDKYHITYVWILKNDKNELIYKTETDSET